MEKKSTLTTLFLIIGNSGAGKDSLIRAIQKNYPSTIKKPKIPKRVVTRRSSHTEDNESVGVDTFIEMKEAGAFVLDWQSYDNYYGVRTEIQDWLEDGYPVIVNVSRDIIEKARSIFPNMKVVFVRVPIDITVNRIIDRGRESYEEVLERVVRAQEHQDYPGADFKINNVRSLEETSKLIIDYITSILNHEKRQGKLFEFA